MVVSPPQPLWPFAPSSRRPSDVLSKSLLAPTPSLQRLPDDPLDLLFGRFPNRLSVMFALLSSRSSVSSNSSGFLAPKPQPRLIPTKHCHRPQPSCLHSQLKSLRQPQLSWGCHALPAIGSSRKNDTAVEALCDIPITASSHNSESFFFRRSRLLVQIQCP